jgi:predicted GNAT family N-acyltransferase
MHSLISAAALVVGNRLAGVRVEYSHGLNGNAELLERFRYRIYVEELGKPLPTADHANKRLPDPDDATGHHFMAFADERMVGCVRLHMAPQVPDYCLAMLGLQRFAALCDRSFGYVSKLMIARDRRGAGIGYELMRRMIAFGHSAPYFGEIAFFHTNPRLVPLYERIGFRRFGKTFSAPFVGRQVPMQIIGGDVGHFQRCASPLLATAKRYPIDSERLRGLLSRIPSANLDSP